MGIIIKSLSAFVAVFLLGGFAVAFVDRSDPLCESQTGSWLSLTRAARFPAALDTDNNVAYAKRLARLKAACGGVPDFLRAETIPAQITALSDRPDVVQEARAALERLKS